MEKISIKEAGRYANFIEDKLDTFKAFVCRGINSKLVEIVETHKKSEAYKEAEDEVVKVECEDDIDVELDTLTEIVESLASEKLRLAMAIGNAKKDIIIKIDKQLRVDGVDEDLQMDLDTSIEYAKLLRSVSREYYSFLINKKASKWKENRKAYAFNVEGNQTPYYYEVEIEKTLKYEKDELIRKSKSYKMLADSISKEIEKSMTNDIVDFQPVYSYLDSVDDIVEKH